MGAGMHSGQVAYCRQQVRARPAGTAESRLPPATASGHFAARKGPAKARPLPPAHPPPPVPTVAVVSCAASMKRLSPKSATLHWKVRLVRPRCRTPVSSTLAAVRSPCSTSWRCRYSRAEDTSCGGLARVERCSRQPAAVSDAAGGMRTGGDVQAAQAAGQECSRSTAEVCVAFAR